MTVYTSLLQYPEGDSIEIDHRLSIGQIVDLNGNPLSLPLRSSRMIVYRVSRIRRTEKTGEVTIRYDLERFTEPELNSLT